MDRLLRDLRFAVRSLRRSPGLTASVVLTLALCVGATTAVFSAVYSVLFRPLPFRDPEGLLLVRTTWQGGPSAFSAGNWADVRRQQTSFEYFVPGYGESFNLSGADAPENVVGARVGSEFFTLLGVAPALGRPFLAEEDAPGRGDVVVLSDGLWRRRFGADPSVIGRQIRLDGRAHTVVGVMPSSLDYTLWDEELWVPTAFTPERLAMHDEHFLTVLARLRPAMTQARAEQELATLARGLRESHPRENQDRGLLLSPLMEEIVGEYRPRLLVLLGSVGFVLLIACANVANLLLARGAARAREAAVRAAIGAGRGDLLRHALSESLVLSVAGGLLGIGVAYWGVAALAAFGPADVPRLAHAGVDGPVLGFALGLTLLSGIASGLAPAVRMAGHSPGEALKEGGRAGSPAPGRDRLRSLLVVAEIALALMLLTGAGLLVRSAVALARVDPGFDPRGVAAGRLSLPAAGYETPEQVTAAFERLAERLEALPGATAAGLVSAAPLEGGSTNGLIPEGRTLELSSAVNSALRLVTPGYFETMRIRLVRGRVFTEQDRAGSPRVMVINETLAREAFPGQDPIGKRIACCEPGPDGEPGWKEVVGVVGDVRAFGLSQDPAPEFYLPMSQAPHAAWNWTDRSMTVAVRGTGGPASMLAPLRQAVAELDPSLPLSNLGTMPGRVVESLAQSRFSTVLLGAFSALALVLAAIGVYGVIAYGVAQRTQEIGIRVALGAGRRDVVGMIVRHGAALAAVGVAFGLIGALALSRFLGSLLFQVSPTDPPTFAVGTIVLTAVAVLAAALPARRAAMTDPMTALRSE